MLKVQTKLDLNLKRQQTPTLIYISFVVQNQRVFKPSFRPIRSPIFPLIGRELFTLRVIIYIQRFVCDIFSYRSDEIISVSSHM